MRCTHMWLLCFKDSRLLTHWMYVNYKVLPNRLEDCIRLDCLELG